MIENTAATADSISSTDSPQTTGGTGGASDSSQFQQSADASELNTNKSVTVTETGKPINTSAINTASSGDWATTLMVMAVVIVFVLVLKWLIDSRPKQVAKEGVAKKKTKKASKSKQKK